MQADREPRYKYLWVSPSYILNLFLWKKQNTVAVPHIAGIPDDVELLSVVDSVERQQIGFLLYHRSWDVVPPGECIPSVDCHDVTLEMVELVREGGKAMVPERYGPSPILPLIRQMIHGKPIMADNPSSRVELPIPARVVEYRVSYRETDGLIGMEVVQPDMLTAFLAEHEGRVVQIDATIELPETCQEQDGPVRVEVVPDRTPEEWDAARQAFQLPELPPSTENDAARKAPGTLPSPDTTICGRFTSRLRKVIQMANQEAQRFNHEHIGTEHLLLGFIMEGAGVGAEVLKRLGVNLEAVRAATEKLVPSGPDMVTIGKLPMTPRAKLVIGHAAAEASRLNHNYVGTEHLLLGMLCHSEGVAARVLAESGVSLEAVRRVVVELLGVNHGFSVARMEGYKIATYYTVVKEVEPDGSPDPGNPISCPRCGPQANMNMVHRREDVPAGITLPPHDPSLFRRFVWCSCGFRSLEVWAGPATASEAPSPPDAPPENAAAPEAANPDEPWTPGRKWL